LIQRLPSGGSKVQGPALSLSKGSKIQSQIHSGELPYFENFPIEMFEGCGVVQTRALRDKQCREPTATFSLDIFGTSLTAVIKENFY
jgi:hypothetical protein